MCIYVHLREILLFRDFSPSAAAWNWLSVISVPRSILAC